MASPHRPFSGFSTEVIGKCSSRRFVVRVKRHGENRVFGNPFERSDIGGILQAVTRSSVFGNERNRLPRDEFRFQEIWSRSDSPDGGHQHLGELEILDIVSDSADELGPSRSRSGSKRGIPLGFHSDEHGNVSFLVADHFRGQQMEDLDVGL